MHGIRSIVSPGVLLRTTAFALGIASAWACRVEFDNGPCELGTLGCECALGICDIGLECVDAVCLPEAGTSEGTAAVTTDLPPDESSSSSTADESSSSDDGVDESSSSTGVPPLTEPFIDATVDGVPSSFDIDPHAYVSPAGTLLVVGSESGGQGADLILRIPPLGAGTFDCVLDDIAVAIYWTVQGPAGPLELSTRTSGVCTITLDEAGEIGEPVGGTFSGELRFPGAMEIPPVTITDGIFRVGHTPGE